MNRLKILFCFLIFLIAAPVHAEDTFWKQVTWTTADGVKLSGLYHPVSRTKAYTWVLLHGLGSVQQEWDAFGRKLAKQGNGVFLYDARGHGRSTHLTTGETISYQQWQTAGPGSQWDAMPSDLASAVRMLQRRFEIPARRVAVGGASLGANVALVYAASHEQVCALVLLSPGVEYAGIRTPEPYKQYSPRPVFIAASPGDLVAYSSVRQLTQYGGNPHQIVAQGSGSEHGVNMLNDDFTQQLLDWMRQVETWK